MEVEWHQVSSQCRHYPEHSELILSPVWFQSFHEFPRFAQSFSRLVNFSNSDAFNCLLHVPVIILFSHKIWILFPAFPFFLILVFGLLEQWHPFFSYLCWLNLVSWVLSFYWYWLAFNVKDFQTFNQFFSPLDWLLGCWPKSGLNFKVQQKLKYLIICITINTVLLIWRCFNVENIFLPLWVLSYVLSFLAIHIQLSHKMQVNLNRLSSYVVKES